MNFGRFVKMKEKLTPWPHTQEDKSENNLLALHPMMMTAGISLVRLTKKV